MGKTAIHRQARPLDDLRVQRPTPVQLPRWLVWALITAGVAYAALLVVALTGTSIPDPCDDFHESPYTVLNVGIVAGSIAVSLVAGHLLMARWWLLLPYTAGALQALIWYWLFVIPKGTC